jgi:hypothetical protein
MPGFKENIDRKIKAEQSASASIVRRDAPPCERTLFVMQIQRLRQLIRYTNGPSGRAAVFGV